MGRAAVRQLAGFGWWVGRYVGRWVVSSVGVRVVVKKADYNAEEESSGTAGCGAARCPMPGRVSYFIILKAATRRASDPTRLLGKSPDALASEGIEGHRPCVWPGASAPSEGIDGASTLRLA